ncbi:MAG TPA: hypothetical protein VGO49_11710 [Bradyrhizobium sp.]|nr:hypothetical protein [Bradyrhizobium sp.]
MIGFPLLLIPLAICNIIVFLMRDVPLTATLATVPLMSGVGWPVTLSDVLIALGILLLMFEVIKGARPGSKYFMDHLLSLLVFGGAAAEFVMLPQFGTSTYFLLTTLALVDFLTGIALRARRSARLAPADAPAPGSKRQRDIEAGEPRFDPEPAPPPATVAETVLLDHPGPAASQPVNTTGTSPEIRSPGLQPNEGAHPSPEPPPR